MNSAAFLRSTYMRRQPVRKSRMSPDPTATFPCRRIAASRSAGVITAPAASQGTPFSAATSSSTPRPAIPFACLSMRVVERAVRRHVARWKAVVELVVVVDVCEPVPLRCALERHEHVVVGVAESAGEVLVRARGRHQVDRIDTRSARLRPVGGERDAEIEHLARLHELRRRHQPLGRDQVRGAALVVLAPAPPVREPLRECREVLHRVPSGRQSFATGICFTAGSASAAKRRMLASASASGMPPYFITATKWSGCISRSISAIFATHCAGVPHTWFWRYIAPMS